MRVGVERQAWRGGLYSLEQKLLQKGDEENDCRA